MNLIQARLLIHTLQAIQFIRFENDDEIIVFIILGVSFLTIFNKELLAKEVIWRHSQVIDKKSCCPKIKTLETSVG